MRMRSGRSAIAEPLTDRSVRRLLPLLQGLGGAAGAASSSLLVTPFSQMSLPDPIALTVQRARPLTVTEPEPRIVASTSPSDENVAPPEPKH